MMASGTVSLPETATGARARADNAPRTSARADANGNVRMPPRYRGRLDEARNAAAKTAGGSTAAAFLSLLGSLLGAGIGAAHASGRNLGRGRQARGEARDREVGRTSTAGGEMPAGADLGDRDHPTILPPTH